MLELARELVGGFYEVCLASDYQYRLCAFSSVTYVTFLKSTCLANMVHLAVFSTVLPAMHLMTAFRDRTPAHLHLLLHNLQSMGRRNSSTLNKKFVGKYGAKAAKRLIFASYRSCLTPDVSGICSSSHAAYVGCRCSRRDNGLQTLYLSIQRTPYTYVLNSEAAFHPDTFNDS